MRNKRLPVAEKLIRLSIVAILAMMVTQWWTWQHVDAASDPIYVSMTTEALAVKVEPPKAATFTPGAITQNGKNYILPMANGDTVTIGDTASGTFKPTIELGRWGGEKSLKVALPTTGTFSVSSDGTTLSWNQNAIGAKWFYKAVDEFNTFGSLEWEVILKRKPNTNAVSFNISQFAGLNWYYQTGDDITDPSVSGSYAIYYAAQEGGIKTVQDGAKYATGKAYHLYRPFLADSSVPQHLTWASYNQDVATSGVLTITVDQAWLNAATYPVTIDPTFGYTTQGASNLALTAGTAYMSNTTYTGAAATGASMSVYSGSSGTNVLKAAVYDTASPANLIANSGATISPNGGWATGNSSSPTFAAVSYKLAFDASVSISVNYDANAAANYFTSTVTFANFPTSTISWTQKSGNVKYQFSIYATYTSASAPTITLSAATNVTGGAATLNGNVTATGGENPTVTTYWGTSDGGQTPASWANSSAPTSPAQPQGVAAFSKNVTSLAAGTLYYFSAKATNSGGTGWPAASLNFTTLTVSLTNSPTTKAFGIVTTGATLYAKGSAPSNPVVDGDCTYTITNNGTGAIDIAIVATNFTGGVGWTLGTPAQNVARLTAYYSGENPASGVVLTTSGQSFYSNLAASATTLWDFKLETPTSVTDGVAKSSTITLTATAH